MRGVNLNDPEDYCDAEKPLEVELRLSPKVQSSTLLEISERCQDIVDDIDAIPGALEDGRLLGIRTVAEQQITRIRNIAANIRADWSIS